MPNLWDKLLLRLKHVADQRGVCVLDIRLLCSNGALLFFTRPKVTRFEPHNNAAMIEAMMLDDDATI
jgi:hypothetical protein